MALKLYREYCLKFYLNARHYVILNGKQGEVHPHTWEFSARIRTGLGSFVEFNVFERGIHAFLDAYQNQLLNEVEPFSTVVPTTENMVEYFGEQFYTIIARAGGVLRSLEGSETPSRSYIVDFSAQREKENRFAEYKMFSGFVDSVLDDILP